MDDDSLQSDADQNTASLAISPDKVCYIIMKAREFSAEDVVTEPDPGSNPADDMDVAVLEDHRDDTVIEELTSLIDFPCRRTSK